MAKRPKPGKCVHCLADPVERNWDHVLPESWYPDSTPLNLSKWTAPSCVPCNDALAKVEDEFLRLVSVCLDPDNPASASIVEKANRSRNPKSAADGREQRIRGAAGKQLHSRLLHGSKIPNTGIYPSLNDKFETPREERVAVMLSAKSFKNITEKMVRGIFWVLDKKFIEPPYSVSFFALTEAGTAPIRELLSMNGELYDRGPGLKIHRAVATDGLSSAFEIILWDQVKLHAMIAPGDS